ncbi:MAG TPA: YkgJ family cysteine cluster protein [Thermoanaerobaculia bacterium]|nr:YkgJ family cysteine cluster protein [Thermoanaerobaculia bacterium]
MATDPTYHDILARAGRFFDEVARTQPQNLRCGRGCSLCCHGLFEIGSADIPLIAEGLARLHPMRRKMIIRRAVEIVEASQHPDLRECTPEEKEAFFDRTAATPCPNLDGSGACLIYEERPLVCRTFGLPLRNGATFLGDICDLNFTAASDEEKERAAWDLQWEDELGPEDEYTIPEAIVLVARLRGWLTPSR